MVRTSNSLSYRTVTMTRLSIVFSLPVLLAGGCAPLPPQTVPTIATPSPSAHVAGTVLPAEARARAFLDAFNSADRATLKQFRQENIPSEPDQVDGDLEFRATTGGFEVKRVEASTATRFTALLKERASDQFDRFDVEVSADRAHLITKLDVNPIPTPIEFAVPRLTEADALTALSAMLAKATAEDHFSGTALVASGSKVIFARAYGLANRETKKENQLGTQFSIGSMNKMFTAVAVLQLVQAGKIELDAPLRSYLPDYPNKDLAAKVTIHHLLTHTGGTGDIFGPDFATHRLELKTVSDYLKLYGNRALEFQPGVRWSYSNYGFLLLGAVIEKVSGRSYYDYVRDHVFAPAGMKSTDSLPEDVDVPARAVGYTKAGANGSGWRPNADTLPYRGTPAGGGYSTAEDLLRFATALRTTVLLDAKHTDLLISPRSLAGSNGQHGYGIGIEDLAGMRCYGHGGGAPGMNAGLWICPKDGYVVTVLANMDPMAATLAGYYALYRLPLR